MNRDAARQRIWDEAMAQPNNTAEFIVERKTIEPGRTFSEEAMAGLSDLILAHVGTRVMRRWNATNEPPSVLTVTIKVEVG